MDCDVRVRTVAAFQFAAACCGRFGASAPDLRFRAKNSDRRAEIGWLTDWGNDVPYITPVPDEVSKPFWDAVQERRLVVQHCTACNRLQYPPRARCAQCNSDALDWKETSGKGHVLTFGVLEDSHLPVRAADQPLNLAVITLDDDQRINFYSNLPGTPVRQVKLGAPVEVTFVDAPDGSLIHEWRIADGNVDPGRALLDSPRVTSDPAMWPYQQ